MSGHRKHRNANNKGNGNGNNKGGTTASLPSKGSCFGCGSPKHKKGDKSCQANGKMCPNCNREGHFSFVCPNSSSNGGGSAKRPPAKSKTNGKAATISNEDPTQSSCGSDSGPVADSNVISGSHSGGFFAICGFQSVVSNERLSHYICDKFGKWKRNPVSKHGMVELCVKPCEKFYHQHNQVKDPGQLVCVARGMRGFFIRKDATRALGIISHNIPQLAEFDNIEKVVHAIELVQVKHDGSEGDGIPKPSSSLGTSVRPVVRSSEYGCPIRELPLDVPDTIPYALVVENIPKLKEWILERYKSSSSNVCPHQSLPLVTSSPPMQL